MKTKIVLSLAVGITAALVSQPVFAGVIEHQLVLTENSSTSLTATYDGSTTGVTVTFLSRDTWLVLFPQVSFGHSFPAWNEPENSGLLNLILLFAAENHLTLHSDFSAPDFTGAKDGTTFHNITTRRSLAMRCTQRQPQTGATKIIRQSEWLHYNLLRLNKRRSS